FQGGADLVRLVSDLPPILLGKGAQGALDLGERRLPPQCRLPGALQRLERIGLRDERAAALQFLIQGVQRLSRIHGSGQSTGAVPRSPRGRGSRRSAGGEGEAEPDAAFGGCREGPP